MMSNPRTEDKPTSDEITKTPLVNLPYGYVLWNQLTKLQRSNNNNKNKLAISRQKEITKTLLDIYASPKAGPVANQIWVLKATTTKELEKLTGYSSRVIDHTRKNIIRIGLLRPTIEIKSTFGKKGPKPWVYAIGIADENDSVEARLRYNEIMKQEIEEDKATKRESKRLATMEIRLKAEARDRLKDTVIQTLVTEFTGLYEKSERPVPFDKIAQRLKSVGLDGDYGYMDVALELEEKGIETGYYIGEKLDPTAKLPPKILEIRKRREAKL